ncbi:MAG TPA: hypothetical protein VEY91_01855 [Candidatus Limnocylindria bacterium]|nr:hypothetical protein [Candidatus Limnocylindria bacterium]
MRSPALLCFVLLTLPRLALSDPNPDFCSPHGGDDNLHLRWDDCGPFAGSVNKKFGCGSDVGYHELRASLLTPVDLTGPYAADMTIEFHVDSPDIVPWWQLGPAPVCRDYDIGIDFTSPGPTCIDYWNMLPGSPVGGSSYTYPTAKQDVAELLVSVAVDPNQARPIPAQTNMYLFTARVPNQRTSACAGCEIAACIVFTRMELFQADNQNLVFTSPFGSGQGNALAGWQGGHFQECVGCTGGEEPCPAVARTWGQIKSIYR